MVTWANPADIVYGTALGPAQLDASASVPGSFAYTPGAGIVLHAGAGQVLSVLFTPADTAHYGSLTQSVVLNVTPATLTVMADNQYGKQANFSAKANLQDITDPTQP